VVPNHAEETAHDIAVAIRGYLLTHPDAADSVDGIHRWWLVPRLRDEGRELVESALRRLVAEGILRRIAREDGRVIYTSGRKRAPVTAGPQAG
jgi:hypothetical protein